MLVAVLFAASALAADCPEEGVPVETFNATLDVAVTAFANMDRATFEERADLALEELPCLADAVGTAHAAKFHRVEALRSYLMKDMEGVVRSFRSSLRLEPDYELPTSLGRPGTPLHQQFEEARRQPPSKTEPVGSAPGEATLVDGRKSAERPTELPVILQWVGEGWEVKETLYLTPGAALPEWAKPRAIDLTIPTAPRKPPSPTPFFVASGALAITSIVASGLGIAWSQEFEDPSTPYDELEGLRDRTNAAAAVSAISGAAALGFGGAGLYVVIRW